MVQPEGIEVPELMLWVRDRQDLLKFHHLGVLGLIHSPIEMAARQRLAKDAKLNRKCNRIVRYSFSGGVLLIAAAAIIKLLLWRG